MAKEFGFITRLMDDTKEGNVTDQRVFKVIIGVRKIIRATCRDYLLAFTCSWKKDFVPDISNRDKLYDVFCLHRGVEKDCNRFRDILGKIVAMKRSEIKEWGAEAENIAYFFKEYFAQEAVKVAAILE